MDSVFSSMQI